MRWHRLLLAVALVASSSARTLPIRRYESNLTPLGITQDKSGVFWLAAADGIVRFDGLRYEAIRPPAGFEISGVKDIDVSPSGTLWLATNNGLVRYLHGNFSRELSGRSMTALTVTSGGRLLASSYEDVYIATEPDKEPVVWARVLDTAVNGRFQTDAEANTWFGCGMHLCVWSDEAIRRIAAGATASTYRLPSPLGRELTVGQQYDWADIVGTPDHGIWARNGPEVISFTGGRLTRRNMPVETFQGVRPGFFLDRSGRLWIPGRELHVVERGELEVFRPSGASLHDVTSMFQDAHGTLWFGLAGRGLAALSADESVRVWADPEGIGGSVLELAVIPRLGLTAATTSGTYTFDAAQDRWRALPNAVRQLAIRCIAPDADGNILRVPYIGGLLRGTREVPLPDGFNRKRMRYLFRDSHGMVWIASIDGLYRLNASGTIVQVPLPYTGSYASDIQADADGRIWVGYQGGVALCTDGKCTDVINSSNGLMDGRIRTIAPGWGEVWVSYRAGIGFSRFVQKRGGWSVTHFTPQQGYGPPDTHFLRRDRRGWIWRGSTDGVYVCDGVHTNPEDWLHLTFGDGVNDSYANMYAWLNEPDSDVWIGTPKGVVRVHPTADWFPLALPRVIAPPHAMRAGQDLEVHLSQPGLPPFQSRLFRYRLLPGDNRWRSSANGTVKFPKLPAETYRLQVAAGGGRPPIEYEFKVKGDAWIYWSVGAGLTIISGVAAFVLLRRRELRKKKSAAAAEYWRQKREFLEGRETTAPVSEPPDDWSGRTLDSRFLLEKRLAGGGFASVYRGFDQARGGEPVAVKLLHPLRDNEQWRRRRFAEEVAALQKIHDAGIVEIRHAGEAAPDRPYLVMEYIEGITLRALLREGRMEFVRAADLLEQIGRALAAAHRAGILHRDLKPENIMIRDAGGPAECIKLIDFGIASLVEEQAQEHTTKLAGSPGYLAPERWVGLASCRSDIYSLAAIAAEMLAGSPVAELGFCAGDPAAFRQRVLALRPTLPQAALDLLAAALAYDPEVRPPDAAAFVRDLSQILLDVHPIVG